MAKKKKKTTRKKTAGKGRGSKAAYSAKQKRMAEHIEDGYMKKGASRKKAERIAWATVNKETGGAKGNAKKPSRPRAGSSTPSRKAKVRPFSEIKARRAKARTEKRKKAASRSSKPKKRELFSQLKPPARG